MLVDKEHVKEYLDVIDGCYELGKEGEGRVKADAVNVPLLYFEATTTSLMIRMLAHPAFPFFPVGGVHVRSRV